MQPVADAVRAPATGSEDASDGAAADPLAVALIEGVRDRLVRPHVAKDHPVAFRSLACQLDDLAPSLQRHARRPAAPRRIQERLKARASLPARSPLAHDAIAAPGEPGDPRWTMPIGKPHNDPRADHDVALSMPTSRDGLDPRPLESWDAHSSRARTRIHLPSIHEGRSLFPWTARSRNELPAGRTRGRP